MSNRQRLTLVLGLIAALVVSAGLIGVLGGNLRPSGPSAAADAAPSSHAITVTGNGTVLVTPDTGEATLGVQIQNASLATAQSQETQTMTAIQNAIKAKGVPEAQIKTAVYNIAIDRNDKNPNQTPQITGYTVTDLIRFSVTPVNNLGPVLQAAIDAGANLVQGVSFTVHDTDTALQQARRQAMDDAHSKAQQLAQLAGVTLGAPISVSEGVSTPPTPQAIAASASSAAALPPVQAGETQITVTVTVSYGF